ncbi:MAG: hypothetical protein WBG01_01495 [Bacteroidota bacterium]
MKPHSLFIPVLATLCACSSLTIKDVDYSWPVESVLSVGPENRVKDRRYSLSFDATALAVAEFQDSAALRGSELRLLRSGEGYYFVTGRDFKQVYVFGQGAHELSLMTQIQVSPSGLKDPALNQRPPYVELIDRSGLRLLLTSGGIYEEEKK